MTRRHRIAGGLLAPFFGTALVFVLIGYLLSELRDYLRRQ